MGEQETGSRKGEDTMIHPNDFTSITGELRRVTRPLLAVMWILYGMTVLAYPLLFIAFIMFFILMQQTRQHVVFIADRIVSRREGYPVVQGFLHERRCCDPKRSKVMLVFLSVFGGAPFYSCRIAVLSKWYHRGVKTI